MTSFVVSAFLFHVSNFWSPSPPSFPPGIDDSTPLNSTTHLCWRRCPFRKPIRFPTVLSSTSIQLEYLSTTEIFDVSSAVPLPLCTRPSAYKRLKRSSPYCATQSLIQNCLQSWSSRRDNAQTSSNVSQTERRTISDAFFALFLYDVVVIVVLDV